MKLTTKITEAAFPLVALAVAISSASASPPISTGPYAINPTPTSDHSLGLKQVLFIRTQFPDLATSKTQADCQTVMGAGKAVLRQFFLRQDRYERDGNGSGLHDAEPVELLRHAKYGRCLLDGVDERCHSRGVC
jgi:hypothetical protein